ncbi:MAG: hypothetical protein ACFB51_20725 [Anaerolineae bacterium]
MAVLVVKREKEAGQQSAWRGATLDYSGGTILLKGKGIGKTWEMTFHPDSITTFAVDQISDITTLSTLYGGGLVGYVAAAIMSRWVKVPVRTLEQAVGTPGQRSAQIRAAGWSPRRDLQEIARELSTHLQMNGYSGALPDLEDEAVWKAPTRAILAGCGLTIALVFVLFIVIFALLALLTP